MIVLDVRSKAEYDAGHLPGAINIPYSELFRRATVLPASTDTPVTVYCGHGPRAWMARAALRARGFSRVTLLRGHMRAWKRAGKPLEVTDAERVP